MTFNKALLISAVCFAATVAAAPASSSEGPCDIYSAGGKPCVAAHSTTRALYASFNSPLYQLTRADGQTQDVSPVSAGGIANSASQDSFCSGTTCTISTIYDQSGKANHLTRALKGYWSGPNSDGSDNLADATAAPVTLGGSKVYGVYIATGTGYRNDATNGIATGNDPEGIYAVLDGTHSNGGCCFDYGNAETSRTDTGNAHMEAIYFGTNTQWGSGDGSGPWVMADLENGLFSGYGSKQNTGDPTFNPRFVTAIVKGDSSNLWAIREGNAQSGGLTTPYSGARPDGYYPMYKEGSIILGIGGDNSNSGEGTFYEGVLTSGYPSDDTENAVQANIVAAGYGTS